MDCRLFKVGEDISHLSFYDISPEEVSLLKKAVSRMINSNDTLPADRDLAGKVGKAIRDCTIFEITEDSKE